MGVSATTKAAHCPWGLRSVSVVNLFLMLGLTCHLHPSPRFRLFLLPCPKSQGVSIPAPFAVGWGAWLPHGLTGWGPFHLPPPCGLGAGREEALSPASLVPGTLPASTHHALRKKDHCAG